MLLWSAHLLRSVYEIVVCVFNYDDFTLYSLLIASQTICNQEAWILTLSLPLFFRVAFENSLNPSAFAVCSVYKIDESLSDLLATYRAFHIYIGNYILVQVSSCWMQQRLQLASVKGNPQHLSLM